MKNEEDQTERFGPFLHGKTVRMDEVRVIIGILLQQAKESVGLVA